MHLVSISSLSEVRMVQNCSLALSLFCCRFIPTPPPPTDTTARWAVPPSTGSPSVLRHRVHIVLYSRRTSRRAGRSASGAPRRRRSRAASAAVKLPAIRGSDYIGSGHSSTERRAPLRKAALTQEIRPSVAPSLRPSVVPPYRCPRPVCRLDCSGRPARPAH